MAAPSFTMRQLVEAGVHFGHSTRRWNPKMQEYIFGERNGVHILDLQQTVPLMSRALEAISAVVSRGGRILFVGTKRAASEQIADAAEKCGQYYVNHRWLGGMLTNWKTVSQSIKRMREIEETLNSEQAGLLSKKEQLMMSRDQSKLTKTLGGIRDMGGLPDMLFVIDTNKEHLAVAEANVLGIPVVGILDSNSDPDGIEFPVPGNDDALRAINTYCELVVDAVLDGLQAEISESGGDAGMAEDAPSEAIEVDGAAEVTDASADLTPDEESVEQSESSEEPAA